MRPLPGVPEQAATMSERGHKLFRLRSALNEASSKRLAAKVKALIAAGHPRHVHVGILFDPPSLELDLRDMHAELKDSLPFLLPRDPASPIDFMRHNLLYSEGPVNIAGVLHEDPPVSHYRVLIPIVGSGSLYAHAGELFQIRSGHALAVTSTGLLKAHPEEIPTLHGAPPGNSGPRLIWDVHVSKK